MGKATYQNGGVYQGDFRRDHRWGWGKHTFLDGSAYEGEWYDDLIEGAHPTCASPPGTIRTSACLLLMAIYHQCHVLGQCT